MPSVSTQLILETVVKGAQGAADSMKQIGRGMEEATAASQKFAAGLAIVAGAVALGATTAINAYREQVKVEKQLEAVLKSTSHAAGLFKEDILEQASALQKLTNYDDEAIASMQNLLLTFTNVKGPIFQEATGTILDMSTALGQDLKSSAIQVGKALQDPILGVSALRRVGVNFSEDQKKVIESLVETGRTADAQKLILKELATEFGGSAQALADPILQMKNAIGDAFEAIGKELLPITNELAKAIQHFAEDVLPKWIEFAKNLRDELKEHPGALIALAGVIGGALIPMIYSAISAIALMTVALLPYMLAGLIIAGLIAGIWWVANNWELVKIKILGVMAAIQLKFREWKDVLVNGFVALGQLIISTVVSWYGAVKQAFADVFQGAKDAVSDAIDWMMEKIKSLLSFITEIPKKVKEIAVGIGGKIGGAIGSLFRAEGGPVTRGSPYVVGEHGPEWFVPNSSGTIIPNNRIGAGITINVNTMIGEEEFIAKLGNRIVRDLAFSTAF